MNDQPRRDRGDDRRLMSGSHQWKENTREGYRHEKTAKIDHPDADTVGKQGKPERRRHAEGRPDQKSRQDNDAGLPDDLRDIGKTEHDEQCIQHIGADPR